MDISLKFVIPNDVSDKNACSKDMLECFELCQKCDLDSAWIKEAQCSEFTWEKHNVVIFQSFEGATFKKLSEDKCVVLGPRCLLACIKQNCSIPNRISPIFMYALANTTITCTNLTADRKKQIKEKVEYMGAIYTPTFTFQTTHLITDSVKTSKYVTACEKKIPVMLDTWVDAVWQINLTDFVPGDSKQFDKFRCPVFHNLVITSTGFLKERNEIIDLVNNNGGVYSGKFTSNSISLLIYRDTQTAKFKAAIKSNISCVTIDWLKDSVRCGYALPIDKYEYKKNLSSTLINPTDSNNHLDFSLMSSKIISESDVSMKSVSETCLNWTNRSNVSQQRTHMKEIQETSSDYKSINLKQVKEAGLFLDGCSVYLSGFNSHLRDKLCKVLNSGGATRYDVISDRVTHVVVGNEKSDDVDQFEAQGLNPIFVSVDWLIESIRLKRIAPESEFKISHNKLETFTTDLLSSPLSKKGVQMLRGETKVQETRSNVDDSTMKMDIMQQYLTPTEGNTGDTLNKFLVGGHFQTKSSTMELSTNSQKNNETIKLDENEKRIEKSNTNEKDNIENFVDENSKTSIEEISCCNLFSGLSFYLWNWEDIEGKAQLVEMIENQDGKVISDKDSCDFIIAVHTIPIDEFDIKFINELWLEECIYVGERVPIKYYHRPIKIKSDVKPLAGLVISVSRFITYERIFLQWLIKHLGAISQDELVRKNIALKNVFPSTHLVCLEPNGSKYDAAKKWLIPIVTSDWIVACEEKQAHVPENKYTLEQFIKNTNISVSEEVANPVENLEIEKAESKEKTKLEFENNISTPLKLSQKTLNDREEKTASFKNITTKDTLLKIENPLLTPKNKTDHRNSLQGSQMTPVTKFLEGLGVVTNSRNTPNQSPLPHTPSHIDTPETPLGRVFGNPNPSPATRKFWARKINSLVPYPHHNYTAPPQPSVTPLSEIKARYWRRVLPPECFKDEESNKNSTDSTKNAATSSSTVVNNQLQELNNMLTKGGEEKSCRRSLVRTEMALTNQFSEEIEIHNGNNILSQTETIGWEEPLENEAIMEVDIQEQIVHKFMLSQISIDDRNNLIEKILSLGGLISDIPNFFDDTATHLLCSVPSRNEKLLSSIASGRWILHVSFVDHCIESGKFVNEEMFEFGNPSALSAVKKISEGNNALLITAAYRWRKQITETGKRAYHGMRAIVLVSANRKDPIIRLIEAGGGTVIDPTAPYIDTLDATHCFIDVKRLSEFPHAEEIAKKGVPCLPHLYLSNYLLLDPQPNPWKCILEQFQHIYENF